MPLYVLRYINANGLPDRAVVRARASLEAQVKLSGDSFCKRVTASDRLRHDYDSDEEYLADRARQIDDEIWTFANK